MTVLKLIVTAVFAYLSGSVSTAVLISMWLYRRDIRKEGSGNAGATNVARTFGIKIGLLTLAGDFLKTALAAWFGNLLAGDLGLVAACAFCMIGHIFPLFFGFKGGKGVATAGMIALILDWRLFIILVAVFGIVFLLSRRVSVCSICCAAAFPIALAILGTTTPRLVLGIFITVIVIWRHHGNIKRLHDGTEPEFKAKF